MDATLRSCYDYYDQIILMKKTDNFEGDYDNTRERKSVSRLRKLKPVNAVSSHDGHLVSKQNRKEQSFKSTFIVSDKHSEKEYDVSKGFSNRTNPIQSNESDTNCCELRDNVISEKSRATEYNIEFADNNITLTNGSSEKESTFSHHSDLNENYERSKRVISATHESVMRTEIEKSKMVTRKFEVQSQFTFQRRDIDSRCSGSLPSTPEGPRFTQEGSRLTYTHPGVQNDLLRTLLSFQMKGDMCDVILRVEGVDFKAHKVVLAAASPYFANLFQNIKTVRMDKLILEGLSARAVAAMIAYFYMAKLIIDADDVEELLESAYYFQTKEVVQLCIDYLEINLALHNCFTFYELALRHDISRLILKVFRYICWNFKSITKQHQFWGISPEILMQVIASNQVKVKTEEEIYSAVWQWCLFDPDTRKHYISKLCGYIHFEVMAPKFIERTLKKEMYLESEVCRQKVDKAIEFIKENKDKDSVKIENYRQVSDNVYIFISSSMFCQMLDLHTCKSEEAPELHLPVGLIDQDYHVTIKAGKRLYTLSKSKVVIFNPESMNWDVFSDGINVADSAICHTKTSIYVVGGKPNSKQLRELSLLTKTWSSLPDMEVDRRSPAAACMGNKKPRIFVAGGYSLSKDCVLNSMECFLVADNIWKSIKVPMSVPRLQATMIIKHDKVFVVGGRSMLETFSSVEIYDRTSERWKTCDGLLTEPKLESSLILFEDKIYSIAGKACVNVDVLEEAEKTKKWNFIGKLDKPQVGLQAVVYQPIS